MMALAVITEIGIFLLISNVTPFILSHFWFSHKILGIPCLTCTIPKSKLFKEIQVFMSKMAFAVLVIIVEFSYKKDFNT